MSNLCAQVQKCFQFSTILSSDDRPLAKDFGVKFYHLWVHFNVFPVGVKLGVFFSFCNFLVVFEFYSNLSTTLRILWCIKYKLKDYKLYSYFLNNNMSFSVLWWIPIFSRSFERYLTNTHSCITNKNLLLIFTFPFYVR